MKKSLILLLTLLPVALFGQRQYADTHYSLCGSIGYGWNTTYHSYGNIDLGAYLPISKHFEMQADIRLQTINCYQAGVQLRPKFGLPVGEMYLEARVQDNAAVREQINDLSGALSVGYRMSYVDAMLGCGARILKPISAQEEPIWEPWNIVYRVKVWVRPVTSKWNINLQISNLTAYTQERSSQPIFGLGGQYDITPHWRLYADAQCKPTGMFHMHATFYGAEVRVGTEYRF